MSTYSSYNSYLGSKSCCKTLCSLCTTSIGVTGPAGATGATGPQGATGPAGAIQPTPNLQQVLTSGNTATNKDILLTNGAGITNTVSFSGMNVPASILNLDGDSVSINTTGNNVGINSGTSVNIVATDGVYLTATNDPMILTSAALMTLNSADGITITTAGNPLNITATGVNIAMTATDNINLVSTADAISLQADLDINLTANTTTNGKINVNAHDGVVITNHSGFVATTTLNGYTITGSNTTGTPDDTSMILSPDELYLDYINSTTPVNAYCRLTGFDSQLELENTSGAGGVDTSRVRLSDTRLDYYQTGVVKPGYFQFQVSGNNIFRYNLSGIQMGTTGTGVHINLNNIKYPAAYHTAQTTLSTNSSSVQTFNISVAPFGCILPNASSTNVGTQFIITNTNVNNLGVTTTGGAQLIYSSTGAPSSISRVLAQGNSQIFTAIQTTGASTYGWSMV